MRSLLVVLSIVAVLAGTAGADFIDTFSYPDGTSPPEYTWTGDPRGGGVSEVQGGMFVHTVYGHIHFFRDLEICGAGVYEFDVTDTEWGFAWRISTYDPDEGSCLVFYHNDYWGSGYNLVGFGWSTLTQYPEGQFMWHNGWHYEHWHYPAPAPVGLHHVRILDELNHVTIWVDDELIFSESVSELDDGYIGLGFDWAAAMTPAFDNVSYSSEVSPVEHTSWGSIKALYR